MITLTREEAQELLNALTYVGDAKDIYSDTIDMLRARLAQPEPEPVAWFIEGTYADGTPSFAQVCETDPEFYVPLYTAPPQRNWQGLTDEEIMDACSAVWAAHPIEVGRVVQDLLKEKNSDRAREEPLRKKKEWQGLTDGDIAEMHHEIKVKGIGAYKTEDIYRAIEAKLKEKNT